MAYPMPLGRNERREHFSDHDRIVLAEQDLDAGDRRFGELMAKLDKQTWAMIGVIITAASATIVGAINLVLGGLG